MERYQLLEKDDNIRYTPYCPIIILSSALTKDTVNDSLLLQIKFQNIGIYTIKSVCISIKYQEGILEHQYLDLLEQSENIWGAKTPIYLPDNNTKKYSIYMSKNSIQC